jgi:HSP20 family protein
MMKRQCGRGGTPRSVVDDRSSGLIAAGHTGAGRTSNTRSMEVSFMRTVMLRNNVMPRRFDRISDFDRLFENVFGPVTSWNDRRPQVDIRSNDDGYEIDADLPGFDEKDIHVNIENDLLTISAERKVENEDNQDGYLLRERARSKFYRSFALPEDVNRDKVDARYKNGVLSLKLHRKPEAKPKQISIKSE